MYSLSLRQCHYQYVNERGQSLTTANKIYVRLLPHAIDFGTRTNVCFSLRQNLFLAVHFYLLLIRRRNDADCFDKKQKLSDDIIEMTGQNVKCFLLFFLVSSDTHQLVCRTCEASNFSFRLVGERKKWQTLLTSG